MAVTRPTKFPEFAVNNIIDPHSGQNNVVEPSDAKKLAGWTFKEFPPRQFFNWLARISNNWIEWFDQTIESYHRTTITMTLHDSGGQIASGMTSYVSVVGSIAVIEVHMLYGTANGGNDCWLEFATSPPFANRALKVVAIIYNNGVEQLEQVYYNPTSEHIQLRWNGSLTGFTTTGVKGVFASPGIGSGFTLVGLTE